LYNNYPFDILKRLASGDGPYPVSLVARYGTHQSMATIHPHRPDGKQEAYNSHRSLNGDGGKKKFKHIGRLVFFLQPLYTFSRISTPLELL
jgi:hypothetical protein